MAINEEIKDKLENAAILIYEKNAHNFGNSNWFARELEYALYDYLQYTRSLIISEILDDDSPDEMEAMAYYALYPYYIDIEELKNREDNVLNDPSSFYSKMAHLIFDSGNPVSPTSSVYGWVDYDFIKENRTFDNVIAAFNIQDDFWSEFEGTFVENSYEKGMIGTFVFKDGTTRNYRYVVDELGSLISEMADKF